MALDALFLQFTLHLSGTLATILVALLIDAIIGDPDWLWRRLPHPVVLFGKLVGGLERWLNKNADSPLLAGVKGTEALGILIAIAGLIGMGIDWLANQSLAGAAVQTIFVAILLAQQSLYVHVKRVAIALKSSNLEDGRKAVSMIVGRDPAQLDRSGISRASIESMSENLSDGVVAPAFWFIIAGMPGLLIYKAVNTADSMIGHRSEQYLYFGKAAARVDDLLNLIPARLTGLLLALAAPLTKGRITKSLAGMIREAKWHRSPNAGWPEAATAHALNVALGGPRRYGNEQVDAPFFNEAGNKDASQRDIMRGLRLMLGALVLHYGLILGIYASLA